MICRSQDASLCQKQSDAHEALFPHRRPQVNPFLDKKGKPLVKIEKMTRSMTMTRYKVEAVTEDAVSFNINYQGSLGALQLMVCRFLNDNISAGCRIASNLWTSNVCTTSDTIHAGILDTHAYRQNCLRSESCLSFPMMNFPSLVTMFDDAKESESTSVISHRTSLNTCRVFGRRVETLAESVRRVHMQRCRDRRESRGTLLQVERHTKELLPRNVVTLIHLLYLYKDERGYTCDDIVAFFGERLLCSRMLTSSNRAFTTACTYSRKYRSDALENVSIKSAKYASVAPPRVSRESLFAAYTDRFGDVGSLSTKLFKRRGRNSNVVDLILNSKDEFFESDKCRKLIALLGAKYGHMPNTRMALSLLSDGDLLLK